MVDLVLQFVCVMGLACLLVIMLGLTAIALLLTATALAILVRVAADFLLQLIISFKAFIQRLGESIGEPCCDDCRSDPLWHSGSGPGLG